MSRPRSLPLVVAAIVWAVALVSADDAAPPAAGIVGMRCTVCHATDLIEQQRLTRPAWDREVAKMIGWGAAVDASQAPEVAAYLASLYGAAGPKPFSVASAPDAAARLLTTRCTVCHGTDLIEGQRLDADGWRRELAKMMGWGAVLAPDERDLLLEHLAPQGAVRR